jgi:hypothetical protein
VQWELWQVATAFVIAGHALPQEPQLKPSLVVSTQLPPQLVSPEKQATPQVPPAHAENAPVGGRHARPHPPQL